MELAEESNGFLCDCFVRAMLERRGTSRCVTRNSKFEARFLYSFYDFISGGGSDQIILIER